MRRVTTLSMVVLLVLASSTPAVSQSRPVDVSVEASSPAGTDDDPDAAERVGAAERADPDEDVLGWENGVWHNESIDVDNSDGLNDSELAAVRDRAMARVEYIRRMEFESTPEIEFISRESYQERGEPPFDPDPREDQFFEAGFWVGEDTPSVRAEDQLYDVVVDGWYIDGITLFKNDTESPRVDPLVLAHELTHALRVSAELEEQMDERPSVSDWSTASGAALEGEASWVESRYERLCDAKWECIDYPGTRNDAVPNESVNMGLYLDFAAKYELGRDFVQLQYERHGIEGVNRTVRNLPQSSEQVIHPKKYRNESPTNVTVVDRTSDGWERIESDEWSFPDTYNFGEAGLYVMLWHNGLIDTEPVNVTVDQQTGLNYSHPASAGWAGDVVVPYANGSAYGYVFKSVWDSEQDAREFHEAYLELLDGKGAEQVRENVYRVPDGPYADAFRVVRSGDTLLVVNAPTVEALRDVHGDAAAVNASTPTGTPTSTATVKGSTDATTSSADSTTPATESPTGTSTPGFGVVPAAIALLGAALLLRRT